MIAKYSTKFQIDRILRKKEEKRQMDVKVHQYKK